MLVVGLSLLLCLALSASSFSCLALISLLVLLYVKDNYFVDGFWFEGLFNFPSGFLMCFEES